MKNKLNFFKSFLVSLFFLLFSFLFLTNTSYAAGSVSPTVDNHGFPSWYKDNKQNQVMPCLDGSDSKCVLPASGEEPNFDPTKPTVFATNFPSEFFYWITESDILTTPLGGKVFMRFAVEGAFANENPLPGDQMVFGRIRITGTGLRPNSTYFATHPYGTNTYTTDENGILRRNTSTEDIGCAPTLGNPCNFSEALASRVFNGFLKWDTGAPDGYLGDAVTPHKVVGSPNNNNFFRIQGPGLPIGGLKTELFTVSGKIFVAPTPPPPGCTDTAPDKPALSEPANASTNISTNPILKWTGIASFGTNCAGNNNQYEVFLDEGNIVPATLKASLPSDKTSLSVFNLKQNTLYSWKIRAKNGILTIDSDVFTFTTTASSSNKAVSSANDANHGFPQWYRDDGGFHVVPCLDGSDPKCVLPGAGEEPNFDPAKPTVFATNFPSEFFYWITESDKMSTPKGGKVFMRFAVEGAFLNGNPLANDQMVFGRIRITGTDLEPNATYTATHPYGVDTFQTDENGIFSRNTSTEDIGCEASPCDFSLALGSRVFGGFLKWDVGSPDGYLGDAITPHKVVGSPAGNNSFKIEGPGLPAGGLTTDLFTVSGKIFTPPVPPCTDTAPDKPALGQPANGTTGISTDPTLSWTAVTNFGTNCSGNNNQYEVFLDEGNVAPITSKGTTAQTTLAVTALKQNTVYSWKVRSSNGALTTDSDVFTFTTINPCTDTTPDAPSLLSPANGATSAATNPTLSWNAIASFGTNCAGNNNQYEVLLNQGNVNPTASKGTIASSQTSLAVTGLLNNTTYSWKVRAKNGAMTSDSSVFTFTTIQQAPTTVPVRPTSLTLSNVSGSIKLNWLDNSNNESEFRIERRVSLSFTYIQIAIVGANITTYTDTLAPNGTNIYRVKACNALGCSSFSNLAWIRKT